MELQDQINIKKAVHVLRSVNQLHRIKILNMLATNGRMTVTDIYIRLRCEQCWASYNLSLLRRAELVNTERVGKNILYSLNEERFAHVVKVIEKLAN